MAVAVQELDGYPGRPPKDFRAFMRSSDALSTWVAEYDGAIAGHVALSPSDFPVVVKTAARALDVDISALAVVARLIVDPRRRRAGVGRALLETAAADARRRGLHPVLDVVTRFDPAVAFYRSCGWRNAGEVTLAFDDGEELQSYVFVGPA
ncbi:MAG: GNAT family N-acetyltransferase [Actinomycetota bacterium]|nr:GNAT family N-acetyltransferase [Actinomycetota bacterium]